MSIESEWMRDSVWPEIETMMWNDAKFRLVLCAKRLTGKFEGLIAALFRDGYVTLQMVTIRRLCDKDDDAISLQAVRKKAREEKPDLKQQIDQLSRCLCPCDHVRRQVNKHVAHTASPEKSLKWEKWQMRQHDLVNAHKAICQVAIHLDQILHWGCPDEIIPDLPDTQDDFLRDLMLWVPKEMRKKLSDSWHQNRRRVNAWKLALP